MSFHRLPILQLVFVRASRHIVCCARVLILILTPSARNHLAPLTVAPQTGKTVIIANGKGVERTRAHMNQYPMSCWS